MLTAISLSSVYFLGFLSAGALAVRARSTQSPVASELFWLAVCVAEWSFFYGLETLSQSPEYRVLWSQLAYLGTYGSVAFVLRFCIRWLNPSLAGWWMSLLWIMPLVMVIGAFTNGLHGLVWPTVEPSDQFDFVYRYGHGPVFWVGISYQYVVVTVSLVVVAFGVRQRRGIYRQQAVLVFLGLFIAVLGNVVYVAGALRSFPLDITPLTLVITTGLLLAGVSRAKLLDLLPAARHRVVEMMPDGLLVVDERLRAIDWNSALLRLWHLDERDLRGSHVSELIPGWSETVPSPPPDSLNASLREGDEDSICHYIDLEMRRYATRNSKPGGWILLFHDATELRAAELRLQEANARLETLNRELARQAVHDGLTGLFNRSYLDEALPRELARAERDGLPIGLLILDIDRFKSVNDEHGHDAGDHVLASVAALVRAQVRAGDIPCRYGGDEIVAVMPGATPEEAILIGERIREAVSRASFSVPGESSHVSVSVSVGVAVFPDDATSSADLFRAADRALYTAKDLGRDRVVGVRDE
ncbi:MAG: diguanylate cyclase [Spirochaetota bacterium]